jgi:hypothetical protein
MLTRALAVFFVGLSLLVPLQTRADTGPNSRYIVFIHYGGGTSEQAQTVAADLARRGYVVRRPDTQRDTVGGPGVDYFSKQDASRAAEVASIVNGSLRLSGNQRLQPRLQSIKNPPGYLGVWLF